jgi:hypothetical protein
MLDSEDFEQKENIDIDAINRDENLLKCRPKVKTDESLETLTEEAFQNETLRPILKLQNDIIIGIFKNYATKYAKNFASLSIDKKEKFIEQSLYKDSKLRSLYKGIVIGHLTLSEYKTYDTFSNAINKRIYSLILERLKSQMMFFEQL